MIISQCETVSVPLCPVCVFMCEFILLQPWTLALFHRAAVLLKISPYYVAHKTVLSRAALAIAACCLSAQSCVAHQRAAVFVTVLVLDLLHAVRPASSVAVCVVSVFQCVCVCVCVCFFVSVRLFLCVCISVRVW